jgi:hypothetical protein
MKSVCEMVGNSILAEHHNRRKLVSGTHVIRISPDNLLRCSFYTLLNGRIELDGGKREAAHFAHGRPVPDVGDAKTCLASWCRASATSDVDRIGLLSFDSTQRSKLSAV